MDSDRYWQAMELLAWSEKLEETRITLHDFLASLADDREGMDGAEYLDTVNAG